MQGSNKRSPASFAAVCPHLGILEDEQTCLSYPSQWNARPAMPVPLEHQRKLCLTPAHVHCLTMQHDQGTPGRRAL